MLSCISCASQKLNRRFKERSRRKKLTLLEAIQRLTYDSRLSLLPTATLVGWGSLRKQHGDIKAKGSR